MDVLLSIKPKYVEEIIAGKKKFEFRKRIFMKKVNKIYIYSSSPVQKIVGYFYYDGYIKLSPEEVWEKTKKVSGISLKSFQQYFSGKKFAYAIKIEHLIIFDIPLNPFDYFQKFYPPQSYQYIAEGVFK